MTRLPAKARLGITCLAFLVPVTCLATVPLLPPSAEPVARVRAWVMGADYLDRAGVRFQRGSSDCGVAALEMLLLDNGFDPSGLGPLRETVAFRGRGLTFLEMQRVAADHGLPTEGWMLDLATLASAPLPGIAHFPGHFVVVDRITADGWVELRDPAVGRVRMSRSRFLELWTGRMLIVSPRAPTAPAGAGAARPLAEPLIPPGKGHVAPVGLL